MPNSVKVFDSIQPAVLSCEVLENVAQDMNHEIANGELNKELGKFAGGMRRRIQMPI